MVMAILRMVGVSSKMKAEGEMESEKTPSLITMVTFGSWRDADVHNETSKKYVRRLLTFDPFKVSH